MNAAPSRWSIRAGAGALGISTDEYRQHVMAGLKWCAGHHVWEDRSAFGVRWSKPDGLNTVCRDWNREVSRVAMARLRARRRAS